MFDNKVKNTIKHMIFGSGIYNIIVLIATTVITIMYCKSNNVNSNTNGLLVKNILGVIIGFIWTCIVIYIMATTIERAVSSQDASYAKKHVIIMTIVRYLGFCILLIVLTNDKILGFSGGILFAVASLGTKIGSYLVPFMERRNSKK